MDERRLQDAFNGLPGPGNDGAALEGVLERVGRARRRRLVVRAATALVVIVAVGFGSLQLYEAVHTPAQLVITDDDMTDADGLKSPAAADQELPADIRALRDDWQAGRIEIDWPPAPDDAPMASLAWMSLDELFGWMEDMALSPEVTAYLRDDADPDPLLAAIRGWPEVTAARFVSSDEALARLLEDLQDPGILADLPTNPLPNSIEIAVSTHDAASVVGERLQARPEVDEARWGADTSSSTERVLVWLRAHAHPAGENTTTTFTAVTQVPPGPDANVDEILVWAQTARTRWTSIHVTGRVGIPGNMVPFALDVTPQTALSATSPAPSPGLEGRMAEYRKSNPTLMRPGEEPVVDDPLDYVINPSYWVRKELGLTAQEVLFVGMASVSGRAAFHLQATFPADLAKETSWDVFVDRDTGIITRFRINPLPGEEGYEQIVETVTVTAAATTASPQTTVTASGQAQTTGSTLATGVTSTVTTLLQRELKWGETATAVGGTVTVGAPVADPAAQAEQPGFNMVSCVVTLTNTGEAPITYSSFDFSLEGRSSGGTGRDTQLGSGGLGRGTLAPGSTVTGTVFFPVHEGDVPVVVWLLNPWSKGERLNWR
ncbi:MAG: permease-like cell division protein FtsX [Thermoleophilia bacterium]